MIWLSRARRAPSAGAARPSALNLGSVEPTDARRPPRVLRNVYFVTGRRAPRAVADCRLDCASIARAQLFTPIDRRSQPLQRARPYSHLPAGVRLARIPKLRTRVRFSSPAPRGLRTWRACAFAAGQRTLVAQTLRNGQSGVTPIGWEQRAESRRLCYTCQLWATHPGAHE
jgi:hypothetical protein